MSSQEVIAATDLPGDPVDAATRFFNEIVPQVRAVDAADILIHFLPAGHEHDAWRVAAVQDLAREAAPRRVNAFVAALDQKAAGDAAADYARKAPGVTGQIFTLGAFPQERN